MAAFISSQLALDRCPHCNVDRPTLKQAWQDHTTSYLSSNRRLWGAYICSRCGGVVIAASSQSDNKATEIYPKSDSIDGSIPDKARGYLEQATQSLHAPAGAIMCAGSAVDAMLKEKGYVKGSLYTRVNLAAKENVITKDMALWAHHVRLDANNQRHADEEATLPTQEEARQSVEFARALAEFMFVLPSRVSQGLQETKPQEA